MSMHTTLTRPDRGRGYVRETLRGDILYNFFRFRELFLSFSGKPQRALRMTDGLTDRMLRQRLITPRQKAECDERILAAFSSTDGYDQTPIEALYGQVHAIRKEVLGAALLEQAQTLRAQSGLSSQQVGIDQGAKKASLLASCGAVVFALTQAELFPLMAGDVKRARAAGKTLYMLCGQAGDELVSRQLLEQWLESTQGISFLTAPPEILPDRTCLFLYGEEGLVACRGLTVDAVVHAAPRGYHAQAVTGLWDGSLCTVFIPKGFDITHHVPLTQKTRLTYSHLARLWQDFGDSIYALSVEELYRRYPRYFLSIYDLAPSRLPICPDITEAKTPFSLFDRQLDEGVTGYLGGLDNVQFHAAYFDETLTRRPVCYDPSQPQPGILVHGVKLAQSAGAKIIRCPKGVTPRQLFRQQEHSQTGLVSNFLFFLTPRLDVLYNDLRADRPYEQADAASGHLDYMLCHQDGKRTETFPLFQKPCIAMKEDGRFLFFPFRLGGGWVDISGLRYRWEKTDVDTEGQICLYTPYFSAKDKDADRDTYRKPVGAGRVNVVMLGDRVTCIRRGDVILPSVGVVLSLTEEAAAPLLQRLTPLEDGYYDVSGLTLTTRLDAPEGVSASDWAQVRWAYGGGLTLIRDGIGLCDAEHMQDWFDREGWTSPLSRQTQESNLHSLVKHPRTAIGCTADGALVVLVYSGRTWRSTGADYREMIAIARQLFPDIQTLMNCDGGGSAMLGLVQDGSFLELSFPSTSSDSCAGQVRPINTLFYMPTSFPERKMGEDFIKAHFQVQQSKDRL